MDASAAGTSSLHQVGHEPQIAQQARPRPLRLREAHDAQIFVGYEGVVESLGFEGKAFLDHLEEGREEVLLQDFA